MNVLEKANEVVSQIAAYATVSLPDLIGSVFIRAVMFFVELMLGL